LLLLPALLAGCAIGSSDSSSITSWDGQVTQWEAAPSRVVVSPDAAVGSGSTGGIGVGGGGTGTLPVCTKRDQGNCCYDGKMLTGSPRCTWLRLGPGGSVTISEATRDGKKTTLPAPLTLTSVAPESFATYDDCIKTPLAFVLTGPGLKEGPLGGDIAHYDLKNTGVWVGRGGGGQSGLVAAVDPGASHDGRSPGPSYFLHEGLCEPLKAVDLTASIQYTDEIDFKIDGNDYTWKGDASSTDPAVVNGFYVVIQKGF
jgi:hypothetical protein